MYKKMLISAVLMTAITACSNSAGTTTFIASNGRTVLASPNSQYFTVIAQPGDVGAAIFCAAGDFARTKLGASVSSRLVVVQPLGPTNLSNGRDGVVFEVLEGSSGAPIRQISDLLVSVNDRGESRTIAHSEVLCD